MPDKRFDTRPRDRTTVRSHTRRTKSGGTTVVRQHIRRVLSSGMGTLSWTTKNNPEPMTANNDVVAPVDIIVDETLRAIPCKHNNCTMKILDRSSDGNIVVVEFTTAPRGDSTVKDAEMERIKSEKVFKRAFPSDNILISERKYYSGGDCTRRYILINPDVPSHLIDRGELDFLRSRYIG